MGKTVIKGAMFPSFSEPPKPSMSSAMGETRNRYTFVPGLQGTQQIKRGLKQRMRHIIDSNDRLINAAGDRVIYSVRDEPDPEYSALHLFAAAQRASDDTGEPWHVCMNYLMDEFDRRDRGDDAEPKRETPAVRSQGGWFFHRLLRRFVSGADGEGTATPAKRDID